MQPEYVMDEHRKHFPFSSSDDSKYLEIAIQKEIRAGRGGPVSYTHLDVYKRQVRGCANGYH